MIWLLSLFFFFNDTATTEIYTLSLHDALPISSWSRRSPSPDRADRPQYRRSQHPGDRRPRTRERHHRRPSPRSEEHTSELQSHVNLVCRLLLEKKKKKQ